MKSVEFSLLKLSKEYGAYLEKISPIFYNNRFLNLITSYSPSFEVKCEFCGTWFNSQVFVLEGGDATRLNLCGNCVDLLSDKKISNWLRDYEEKRRNILKNIKRIKNLSSLLLDCRGCKLSCSFLFEDAKEFVAIVSRMCCGFNLNAREELIVESYLDGRSRLCT